MAPSRPPRRDGDARTWTFSGLDPETDYTLTVTPLIGAAEGTPDSADVTTDASTAPPTAPGTGHGSHPDRRRTPA